MPALPFQGRFFTRVVVVLLVAAGLVVASWGLAAVRFSAIPSLSWGDATAAERTAASTDRTIATLQARLREAPGDWQAYSQLGSAYLQKARETGDPGYYQKAEGALEEALARAPDDYTAVSGMGALALARHRFGEALEWGERARRINPNRPYAYGVIADAQIELGHYAEAVETLQLMVDLRPDMNSYSRISYIRELHGDVHGAIEMMRKAVDGSGAVAETTAWFQTQLANLYFNQGDLDGAEREYRLALARFPGYAYALGGLGRLRATQGRNDEAIALLSQATEVMPLPEFVVALGDVYWIDGQADAAREQYELVRAIQALYVANGVDLDLEMALFDADHGADPAALVERARSAYARRPGIYGADVLAWALYRNGEYAEAWRYSREALRLGTRDALLSYHHGMIAYRLHDYDAARAALRTALSINPHFSLRQAPEARALLDRLDREAPDSSP